MNEWEDIKNRIDLHEGKPGISLRRPSYLSNTRISTFQRCLLKYFRNYGGPRQKSKSLGLRRGAAGHEALAAYYRGERDHMFAEAWKEFDPRHDEAMEDYIKLEEVLIRYVHWADTQDRWIVKDVEMEVYAEYEGIQLMGKWDLLVEHAGEIWIVDHKFNKVHSNRHLAIDSQVSFYLSQARILGIPARGVIYNTINLAGPRSKKLPATRDVATRTDEFIDAFLNNVSVIQKQVQDFHEGNTSISASFTRDCHWDCQWHKDCSEGKII